MPPLASRQGSDDEVSFFALGAAVLRYRFWVLVWILAGGVVAVVPLLLRGRTWTATASFVPQGGEVAQSGIRTLAGQFGVAIPGSGSGTQSPEFYALLAESRVILGEIADDSVMASESGDWQSVADLFKVKSRNAVARREGAVAALRENIEAAFSRSTGVITISVTTKSPKASLAIAEGVLRGVNRFNLLSRQAQASEERRFIEGRLAAQRDTLARSEAMLGSFLKSNRQFEKSPDLTFEYDRLQREVALQQEVLIGLAQSYEDSRIREVRDVPVVSVIEPPILPVRPDGRGAGAMGLLGMVIGAILGMLVAISRDSFTRRRARGDEDAARFDAVVREARGDLRQWLRRPTTGTD